MPVCPFLTSVHVSFWTNLFCLYASFDFKITRLISIKFGIRILHKILQAEIIFEMARFVSHLYAPGDCM
jgi:hypothetical protein